MMDGRVESGDLLSCPLLVKYSFPIRRERVKKAFPDKKKKTRKLKTT